MSGPRPKTAKLLAKAEALKAKHPEMSRNAIAEKVGVSEGTLRNHWAKKAPQPKQASRRKRAAAYQVLPATTPEPSVGGKMVMLMGTPEQIREAMGAMQ